MVKYSTLKIKQNILLWLRLVQIYKLFNLSKDNIQIFFISVSVMSTLQLERCNDFAFHFSHYDPSRSSPH